MRALAFDPAGRHIASIDLTSLRIWDARQRQEIASFPRSMLHEDFALAFHPGGKHVAAALDVRTVALWDIATGRRVAELRGHSDEIRALAFTPSGTRLVSASADGTVRIWDVAAGVELCQHAARVFSLSFSPDACAWLQAATGR